MKINKIVLNNIGPYEGINEFDILGQRRDGKVVLIGGKNGAGKTTLFSAIKICLYGCKACGYQESNIHYKREIKRLINNNAKREQKSDFSVNVAFEVTVSTEIIQYDVSRKWILNGTDINEIVEVLRGGDILTEEEKNDFESYMLNIIPPELFDLYFFDGEKITDFFLEDGSNARIKNAFLTLCGYDTFEIMYKNFKRLSAGAKGSNTIVDNYLKLKENYEADLQVYQRLISELEEKKESLELTKTSISGLEKRFRGKGGITINEYTDRLTELKQAERFREEKNEWIKKAANEIIPFIILKNQILELEQQVQKEESQGNSRLVAEKSIDLISHLLFAKVQEKVLSKSVADVLMNDFIASLDKENNDYEELLGLSLEEKRNIFEQIALIKKYSEKDIIDNRKEIEDSINRTRQIREEIDNSSESLAQEYIHQKDELLNTMQSLMEEITILADSVREADISKTLSFDKMKKEEKLLEEELKKKSVVDLSQKASVMLLNLQNKLLSSKLRKVEEIFMDKIGDMARKSHFIDDIRIDDDFGIHIFKTIRVSYDGLRKQLLSQTESEYVRENGVYHLELMKEKFKVTTYGEVRKYVEKHTTKSGYLSLLYEIDKSTLSKGEKQMFIMTLYWSIMKLCKQDVPFIIDTPFARIDTEHRDNITSKFFKELNGQVFIFSTDEEIVGRHYDILSDVVQAVFMLENVDNQKTNIDAGSYFGG